MVNRGLFDAHPTYYKRKVWLIGGTSESAAIARILITSEIVFIVTVVTQAALSLYSAECETAVGCMDREKMQSFCHTNQVKAIVDASHPYAVEVSRQAIAISNQLNIPYLRYERNCYQAQADASTNRSVIELDSFETLLTGNYLKQQRVLLTVGCKALPLFQAWHHQATLFARILPKAVSIETALLAGFTSDRLIAIRPPFNLALEKALWQRWNISMVVTKASGKAGGEDIKRQVAADLNVPLIIITRPQVAYPQQTYLIPEVLAFCQQL